MKCTVCGKQFTPVRTAVYLVLNAPSGALAELTSGPKTYDAIDCPRCGCQHVLKERLPMEKGEVNE